MVYRTISGIKVMLGMHGKVKKIGIDPMMSIPVSSHEIYVHPEQFFLVQNLILSSEFYS